MSKKINKKSVVLKKGDEEKKVKIGFSWITLILGPFAPLFRMDWKWSGILFGVIIILSLIIKDLGYWIIVTGFSFVYNKIYIKDLLKKGWKPLSAEDREILNNYTGQIFQENGNTDNQNHGGKNTQNNKGIGNNSSNNLNERIEKYIECMKYFNIDRNLEITSEVIKKAYKSKIKKVHPDRNPDKDTTAETIKVNEVNRYLEENLEYYLSKKN